MDQTVGDDVASREKAERATNDGTEHRAEESNSEGLAKRPEVEQNSRPALRIRRQHQLHDVEQPANARDDLGGRDIQDHEPYEVDAYGCCA